MQLMRYENYNWVECSVMVDDDNNNSNSNSNNNSGSSNSNSYNSNKNNNCNSSSNNSSNNSNNNNNCKSGSSNNSSSNNSNNNNNCNSSSNNSNNNNNCKSSNSSRNNSNSSSNNNNSSSSSSSYNSNNNNNCNSSSNNNNSSSRNKSATTTLHDVHLYVQRVSNEPRVLNKLLKDSLISLLEPPRTSKRSLPQPRAHQRHIYSLLLAHPKYISVSLLRLDPITETIRLHYATCTNNCLMSTSLLQNALHSSQLCIFVLRHRKRSHFGSTKTAAKI